MPYGIDKKIGGDNPANVRWVESCVRSIMSKDKTISKETAIRICKIQLKKKKESK